MPETDIKEFKGVFTNADLEDISPEHQIVLKNLRPRNGRLVKTFAYGNKLKAQHVQITSAVDAIGTFINENFLLDKAYLIVWVDVSGEIILSFYDLVSSNWKLLSTPLANYTVNNTSVIMLDTFYHKNATNPVIQDSEILRVLPGNVGKIEYTWTP